MGNALNLSGIALTTDQGKWRRLAAKLSKEVLAPRAAEVDRTGAFPRESIKALGEAGLMGLTIPKEYGGPGGNILTTTFIIEELAKGCASTSMVYTMHITSVPILIALCSPEQRKMFLEPIAKGEMLIAVAMTEPGSGNRLWHMDSFAAEENGHFIIDSFKSFATSCGEADYYLVPLRDNANVGPTELSLFMVDGKDKNVKPIGVWDGMGLRGNSSRPVHFDKCIVPPINRLGLPTQGHSMMFAYTLPIYQCGLSANYLGIAQSAFDVAKNHVEKRIHSDTKTALSTLETIQRYIAEMHVRLDQARHLVYRVSQMADNAVVLFDEFREHDLLDEIIRANPDDPFFVECAQIKIAACEMAIDVTNKAIQVCGGSGYKRGHLAEMAYRNARAGSVMGPSDDALKLIIGRQILGLPQPWELQ